MHFLLRWYELLRQLWAWLRMRLTALLASQNASATFSPLSLSPRLWVQVSSEGLADNAAITVLHDRSGNGNNMGTVSGSVVNKTGIVNGKAVARFDGSSKIFGGFTGPSNPPLSIVLVAKFNTPFDSTQTVISDGSSLDTQAIFRTTAADGYYYYDISGQIAKLCNTNAWHMVCVISNGASSSVNVDNLSAGTGAMGGHDMGGLTLGNDFAGSMGAVCDIAEAIVIPHALSPTELSLLFTYLNSRYAIY